MGDNMQNVCSGDARCYVEGLCDGGALARLWGLQGGARGEAAPSCGECVGGARGVSGGQARVPQGGDWEASAPKGGASAPKEESGTNLMSSIVFLMVLQNHFRKVTKCGSHPQLLPKPLIPLPTLPPHGVDALFHILCLPVYHCMARAFFSSRLPSRVSSRSQT